MTDRMGRWVAAMRARRYNEAWALADQTLRERDPTTRDDPSLPYHLRWVWSGEPVDGRDVLVRCYHGLGDTLQFARFLPQLADRATSVTVEVQDRLIDLVQTVDSRVRLTPFDLDQPLPAPDLDLEITELCFALRIPPTAGSTPYLKTTRAALPDGTIGLCYGSGGWDRDRSVPSELFRTLCRSEPVVTLMAEPTDLPVLNPAGCPFDMDATVALVAGVSLVITVDTMIAHLAGALGRTTWLLLKAEPDWRWSPQSHTTDWYPSMRLYTQPRPGDWGSVVAAVEADLARSAEAEVRA